MVELFSVFGNVKLWTILSAILGGLAGLVTLKPWPRIVNRFQLRHIERERRDALKHIERLAAAYDRAVDAPDLLGAPMALIRTRDVMRNTRLTAGAFDKMHAMERRSYGLPPYSIQEPEGFLSARRINRSFDEIRDEAEEAGRRDPRDLSTLAGWLIAGMVVSAVVAACLS